MPSCTTWTTTCTPTSASSPTSRPACPRPSLLQGSHEWQYLGLVVGKLFANAKSPLAADLADQLSSELEAAWQEATGLRQQLELAQSTVKGLGDQLREREQALAVAHARNDEIRNRATQLTEQLTAATAQNSQLLQTLTGMQQAKSPKPK